MLPWYEFCLFDFFSHVIHYIIAWYAQISWTPTYHITMPAARRASGKGRVSDFSATRVRVEGEGSPRVAEKVTHEAPTASGIREVEKKKKITFFLMKMGLSLVNWLFQ
jgi:hypothetical protein